MLKKVIKKVDGKIVTIEQPLTTDEIAEVNARQAEFAANEYKYNRASEYPDIGDQLDEIWKFINQMRLNGTDLPQDTDDMLGKILAVKKKHPKPS